jgi:hypothetical protein
MVDVKGVAAEDPLYDIPHVIDVTAPNFGIAKNRETLRYARNLISN